MRLFGLPKVPVVRLLLNPFLFCNYPKYQKKRLDFGNNNPNIGMCILYDADWKIH